ncbi:MAG TPA: DinB family protein [Bryobacteraceae bacterium]|nr:DinB family protein [Bryobacteraceae bacterium]
MDAAIPLSVLNELFDYHWWARDRQLAACAALTEEQFLRPLGGSFASIRDTLVHLVAVEWLWLERWRGAAPKALLAPRDFPTLDAVAERWSAVELEMRSYLAGLTGEILARPMTCVSTRGNTWTFPLWRMLFHLINHQSYHRGQITTLLRQLGVEPAKVDFLDAPASYSREVGNVREM